ncbi:MAG TPA: M48 family metallopeptidase [Hyphomicrobiaceae bacterium]|nr:M48 family metallopeptidase [Hyphomicrobiaceae bacterium]
MRRSIIASAAGLLIVAAAPAAAQLAKSDDGGVKVKPPSLMRRLVPAEKLEKVAAEQYGQLRAQAMSRNALVAADDPVATRVGRIAQDLMAFTPKWNARAKDWRWDITIIKTPTINALCMPGGKIAVFTGIIDTLKLTDDELAVVLGHEMAHALREHARARTAKVTLTNVGTLAIGLVIGGNVAELARQGGGLLALKFNRDDERDADLVGLELAARAGYNPQAGLTLWEKMSQAAKNTPPTWLSTHPSGEDRKRRTQEALQQVMPLYEKAKANKPPAAAAN